MLCACHSRVLRQLLPLGRKSRGKTSLVVCQAWNLRIRVNCTLSTIRCARALLVFFIKCRVSCPPRPLTTPCATAFVGCVRRCAMVETPCLSAHCSATVQSGSRALSALRLPHSRKYPRRPCHAVLPAGFAPYKCLKILARDGKCRPQCVHSTPPPWCWSGRGASAALEMHGLDMLLFFSPACTLRFEPSEAISTDPPTEGNCSLRIGRIVCDLTREKRCRTHAAGSLGLPRAWRHRGG